MAHPPPFLTGYEPRRSLIKITNNGLVRRAEQNFKWHGGYFTAVAEFCMNDTSRPWGYGRIHLIHWTTRGRRSGTIVWDSSRDLGDRRPTPPLFFGVEEACLMTPSERIAAVAMLTQLSGSMRELFS